MHACMHAHIQTYTHTYTVCVCMCVRARARDRRNDHTFVLAFADRAPSRPRTATAQGNSRETRSLSHSSQYPAEQQHRTFDSRAASAAAETAASALYMSSPGAGGALAEIAQSTMRDLRRQDEAPVSRHRA